MSLAATFACTKGELHQLNMCRIYLRVISVAEITNFDGTHIKQTSYDGKRNNTRHTIRWHNQQLPTKGGVCIWQYFLLAVSDSNRYLQQPLGKWFDISLWHHQGEWFIESNKRTLLHQSGKSIVCKTPSGSLHLIVLPRSDPPTPNSNSYSIC
jgi:hypothetical protein